MFNHHFPRLVSDIGGTNARFSIEIAPYQYQDTKTLVCKDYPSLANAISSYLSDIQHTEIKHAALAVPSPIIDDTLFMVNSPWHLSSMQQTKLDAKLESLIFLNDFHALALSIPHISEEKLVKVGGMTANPNKPIALIGPGTGLGMATLIKHPIHAGEYFAIPAEGGRSSFAAVGEEEFQLWQFVHKRFQHVSVERFLSGPGLQLIYEALCSMAGITIQELPTPNEISEKGVNRQCSICTQTLDHFCRILGTMASNLACITSSFGGIYIGGGIVPKILEFFQQSDFRSRFEDKGRYRVYLEKMPVYVITHQYPAMLGSSYALDTYLNKNYIP